LDSLKKFRDSLKLISTGKIGTTIFNILKDGAFGIVKSALGMMDVGLVRE